jgi:two-component system response regulator GlrR
MKKEYRILVVDDEQGMLSLLESILLTGGYDVKTELSGEEALTEIQDNMPNLVITDLFMGEGMNGMQLMENIHKNSPLLPVIILSGLAKIKDAVQATHMVSAEFLTKPLGKEKLL